MRQLHITTICKSHNKFGLLANPILDYLISGELMMKQTTRDRQERRVSNQGMLIRAEERNIRFA